MAKEHKSRELSDYLGKYVQLQDGRKGMVMAPSPGGKHYRFLVLKDRLDHFTLNLVHDDGLNGKMDVWRELGTMENEPIQPHVLLNDIKALLDDVKRFRELQRLLK